LSVGFKDVGVFLIEHSEQDKLVASLDVKLAQFEHLSDLSDFFLVQRAALSQSS
jgi:hypothetical protein